jgi:hypothetical protein
MTRRTSRKRSSLRRNAFDRCRQCLGMGYKGRSRSGKWKVETCSRCRGTGSDPRPDTLPENRTKLAKNSRRRSSLHRNSYKSVPAGRKVVLAFLDKHPASSSKLSTDGRKLDGLWMGGSGIAEWSGGKIVFNDLGSRSAQTVQRQIRRLAPASWLRPNSRRRSSRR